MKGHCLQAMKIVHHHANGCFDWLISGQQIGNRFREALSIISGNTKDLRLSILWEIIMNQSLFIIEWCFIISIDTR